MVRHVVVAANRKRTRGRVRGRARCQLYKKELEGEVVLPRFFLKFFTQTRAL